MRKNMGPWLWAIGVASLAIIGCQSVQTTEGGVVGVTRQQRVSPLVNRDGLNQQAVLQYKQVLGEAQKKQALNADHEDVERVRRIANRIIPQTAVFRADAVNWKWEVNVISSKELNAWCMPGGKIAVYTGLIDGIKATDDELAQVMGHEIAHALREHAWERASSATNAGLGLGLLGLVLGADTGQMDMAGMAYNVMFELPNSRDHETEADRIGIELAARAGYDPRAAVTLWQKMGKASEGAPPKWLSTHPPSGERQGDLKLYGDKVMPLFDQARRAGRTSL
jgi:predicted Zn-dependent protease